MRTFGSARGSIAVRRVALPLMAEAKTDVAAGAAVCAGGPGPSTDDSLRQIELHLAQIRANEEERERRLAVALNAGEAATTLLRCAALAELTHPLDLDLAKRSGGCRS